jgi:hypothetical protein
LLMIFKLSRLNYFYYTSYGALQQESYCNAVIHVNKRNLRSGSCAGGAENYENHGKMAEVQSALADSRSKTRLCMQERDCCIAGKIMLQCIS